MSICSLEIPPSILQRRMSSVSVLFSFLVANAHFPHHPQKGSRILSASNGFLLSLERWANKEVEKESLQQNREITCNKILVQKRNDQHFIWCPCAEVKNWHSGYWLYMKEGKLISGGWSSAPLTELHSSWKWTQPNCLSSFQSCLVVGSKQLHLDSLFFSDISGAFVSSSYFVLETGLNGWLLLSMFLLHTKQIH